ncbi:lysozyme [Amycolatopsis sp.]|uniref:lysozyme n=1 Tax=Amycolatopsis sp. TaxID=37632 RepID=UPI002D7F5717|nr:lysozyme [Amycolatopsis sp.]HET6709212.1 lysozyme [Amycolatopsis sp.]
MRVKRRSLPFAAVLASVLLGAGQAPAKADDIYAGAQEHFAGSQIAKVEGVGEAPGVLYGGDDQQLGHDVSGHQGPVDWRGAAGSGAKFVYVKATEGTGFVNPQFAQQYNGSYNVGLIRGAYHFARPDISDGAAQARYFLAHGGGWSADGKTLPGALDAEYNPYGETCYGKDAAGMVAWLRAFSDTYRAATGRPPTIYTSTSWWKRCTANNGGFGANPLWIARYNSFVGELPAGWSVHTIWQFADRGTLPGDQNWFNGSADRLRALALG